MSKIQAFAWDTFPNGGLKGVAKVFNSMDEASDWLKFQPQVNRMAVPLERAPDMWELAQEKMNG